ncbi:MAG: ATP-binding cassette domain-containing protein [Candidatus Pacebacteria bacterium]|nr:ATP-binding cassette domain-containing protein [Candidatus Paceibacterota bacterium]
MSVIRVRNLKKYYRVYQKEPGLLGSMKSLLRRKYQPVKAVDNISFSIGRGELVGFIGPNGAGKTTTLKCLSGLLFPNEGTVEVLGFTPWDRKPEFQKQFSLVMGQKNQLWWDLPPIETFILNREIYEVPQKQYEQTLNELVKILEVEEVLKIQTRKLSLGQRMKCELIAALIHSPKVLFLDEPTIGLDVVMQKRVRDFIKLYNRRFKSAIILTSHNMDDVKELCQRVLIIDRGRLVFDGRLSEIISKYADHKIVSVVFSQEIDPKKLAKIGQVKSYHFPEATLSIKRETAPLAAAELLQHFPIADLTLEEEKIEDIIRELFTGKDYA